MDLQTSFEYLSHFVCAKNDSFINDDACLFLFFLFVLTFLLHIAIKHGNIWIIKHIFQSKEVDGQKRIRTNQLYTDKP